MTVFMALRAGAIDGKTGAADRIIDEIDFRSAQVINRNFIDDHLHTIGFEGGIHIPNIIVQRHPEIYTTASTACDIHAQSIPLEIAFGQNVLNCIRGCRR
jgi:hypothetical protein